ncbi:sensor histidine kinase [Xanthocytophaga flava]|uniref:sensor histidine kinase n=1 Tax=Xanthocytophaga flava TaxID=3048013 RepID=UPI0028D205CE|nr:histidine kinase [Xanthocytophaga flavus]MDJ1468453.1 histidine kinase [Xanthocytophaga flavus]
MATEKVIIDDMKYRWVGVPLIGLVMHFFSHDTRGVSWLSIDFLQGWLTACSFTFLYWVGNAWIWKKLTHKFPHYSQTRKRLLLLALYSLLYSIIVPGILDVILMYFTDLSCTYDSFMGSCLVGLIPTFLCLLIYESVFFFESWKANVKKTEASARENVQSQLETLKNQLDPHFLFNSLNTLASLIDDENAPAQEYLERLADVYRYVLVSREKNTVTLEEEMNFLDAYIYLNKVRFRENLKVEKKISSNAYQQQVAPLSIQMLVENAIKHNIVSKDKPLTIKISQEDGNYLAIENNVQEKITFEKSTKVGLQNIINRYSLLTDKQVNIHKSPDLFTVRIPLLQAI